MKERVKIGKNVTDIMRMECIYSCHKDGDGRLCYLLYDWDDAGQYIEAHEGDWLVMDGEGHWSVERKKA